MKFKFSITSPLFSKILKSLSFTLVCFLSVIIGFVSCSAGKEDGIVSISLPSRSAFGSMVNSASREVSSQYATVFLIGDYSDKKTVALAEGENSVVTFDSIPTGSMVRVVCTWNGTVPDDIDSKSRGAIGVSDEVTIVGGSKQTASVTMRNIRLTNQVYGETGPTGIAKIYYDGDFDSYISLPGLCTYKFKFISSESAEYTTSSSFYEIFGTASAFAVTAKIFYGDTEVLSLYVPNDGI